MRKAGFLAFPSGKLSEDTSAPQTSLFYDRPYSKWLPVWRNGVSPDGRRYVYTTGDALGGQTKGKVRVVDVVSGIDRVLFSGSPIFRVVDFAREGIYLSPDPGEGRSRGLWLLDPAGGAPHLISRSLIAPFVEDGVVWAVDFNTADKHPAQGGLEGPENEVVRLNPASGTTTRWFYLPGADLFTAGFDLSGHPIMNAYREPSFGNEIWLVTSATTATKLFDSSAADGPGAVAAQDRHGVWFDGRSSPLGGVWLYDGATLRPVATTNADTFVVAGGCIP